MNFQPIVDWYGSHKQVIATTTTHKQVPGYLSCGFHHHKSQITSVNPLSPHDALKHHFTSLKTDLIFLQLWVLK